VTDAHHATMKLLTMRTKVEKKNIIICTNKQTYSVTIKTILLIIKIKIRKRYR